MDPAAILGDPVIGEADPDVVVVGGLRFHAMCPHHLLPYRGVAHVAYLPRGKLVGFGRLAELVDCFTKRLTLQERATHQIADALCRHLGARGAGCVIEAEQLCLALPGEKHDQSGVVTSAFVGEMRERPDLKARLLEAANLGRARAMSGGPRAASDATPRQASGAASSDTVPDGASDDLSRVLAGKVAVVTGASRGIGRAIAALLAGAGAGVAGCARHAAARHRRLRRGTAGRRRALRRRGAAPLRPARPAGQQRRRRRPRAPRRDVARDLGRGPRREPQGDVPGDPRVSPGDARPPRRPDRQRGLDLGPAGDGGPHRLLRGQARRRRADARAGRGAPRRRHRRQRRLPGLGRHRDAARGDAGRASPTCRPRTSPTS